MRAAWLLAVVISGPGCIAQRDEVASDGARRGDGAPTDAAPPDALRVDGAPTDAAPACPPPRPLAECFRGVAFADCGGDGEPAIYCQGDPYEGSCLWFEGGCPAQGFTGPCVRDEANPNDYMKCAAASPFSGYGRAPWTRTRAMNVALRVDPAVRPGAPGVACAAPCGIDPPPSSAWPDGRCFSYLSFCDPLPRPDGEVVETYGPALAPRPDLADWGLPSLVVVALGRTNEISSRELQLELDLERGQARACVIESTDTPEFADHEPLCADAGEVVVDHDVRNAADVVTLHGTFDVRFPPFAPFRDDPARVTGLELVGAF